MTLRKLSAIVFALLLLPGISAAEIDDVVLGTITVSASMSILPTTNGIFMSSYSCIPPDANTGQEMCYMPNSYGKTLYAFDLNSIFNATEGSENESALVGSITLDTNNVNSLSGVFYDKVIDAALVYGTSDTQGVLSVCLVSASDLSPEPTKVNKPPVEEVPAEGEVSAEQEVSTAEQEASAAEQEASTAEQEASTAEQEASTAEQEASAAEQEASAAEQEASAAEQEASAAEQEASAAEQEASAAEQEVPAEQPWNITADVKQCKMSPINVIPLIRITSGDADTRYLANLESHANKENNIEIIYHVFTRPDAAHTIDTATVDLGRSTSGMRVTSHVNRGESAALVVMTSDKQGMLYVGCVSLDPEKSVTMKLLLTIENSPLVRDGNTDIIVHGDLAYLLHRHPTTESADVASLSSDTIPNVLLSRMNVKELMDVVGGEVVTLPSRDATQSDLEYRALLEKAVEGKRGSLNMVPTGVESGTYDYMALSLESKGGQLFVLTDISESPYLSTSVYGFNMKTLDLATKTIVLGGGDTILPSQVMGYRYASNGVDGQKQMDRMALLRNARLYLVKRLPNVCPNQCYPDEGYGVCAEGECVCAEGRIGNDCSLISCSTDCGVAEHHGVCDMQFGRCRCESIYTGSNCESRQCPNACNSNGECSGDPDYVCTCSTMWTGESCSIEAMNACYIYTDKKECLRRVGACGWCDDVGQCFRGDAVKPRDGYCMAWHVEYGVEAALSIVIIVIIVLIAIFFLIDAFSILSVDYVTAAIMQSPDMLLTSEFLKEAYWRDERSTKLWKLLDCIQHVPLVLLMNVTFPTLWIQFSRYFSWSVFYVPSLFPGMLEDLPTNVTSLSFMSSMSLSSVQFGNAGRIAARNVFVVTLLTFLIALCALLLLYVVYAFVMWLCLRSKEPNIFSVLFGRFFHYLTRIVLLAYLPLVTLSCFHLRHAYSAGTTVVAVLTVIIIGLLVPAFNWFVVRGKGKHLLFLYLKIRFGSLYTCYHYQKAMFNLAYLGRKFLVAAFLGFLSSDLIDKQDSYIVAQIVLLVLVHVFYLVILVAIRPYLDPVHFVLDIVLNILSCIFFGSAAFHRDSPSQNGLAYSGVCVILQIISCFIAYIITWTNILDSPLTMPWIVFGPRYNGEFYPANADEMKVLSRQDAKEQRATLNSTLPSAQAHQRNLDTSVDASLQSSEE